MEAIAPILKFQPSDVKSRLVRDICELARGAAYSAKKVKSLAALGPHLDAFDAEDRQTLISQAVQLAKNNSGNHSTWDAITAMGGYLKEGAPHELDPLGLGPLMDSRPELRQRLEDSIKSTNENSARTVGDQNRPRAVRLPMVRNPRKVRLGLAHSDIPICVSALGRTPRCTRSHFIRASTTWP